MSCLAASIIAMAARRRRAQRELARAEAFDARAARDEDQRALAAEHEERRQFTAEYDAWLDGTRAEMPDPTPADLDKTVVKYS